MEKEIKQRSEKFNRGGAYLRQGKPGKEYDKNNTKGGDGPVVHALNWIERNRKILVTNDFGCHHVLNRKQFVDLLGSRLDKKSSLSNVLEKKGFLRDRLDFADIPGKWKQKNSFLFSGTGPLTRVFWICEALAWHLQVSSPMIMMVLSTSATMEGWLTGKQTTFLRSGGGKSSCKSIMSNSQANGCAISSNLESLPMYFRCAYKSYCGVCPVVNYESRRNI